MTRARTNGVFRAGPRPLRTAWGRRSLATGPIAARPPARVFPRVPGLVVARVVVATVHAEERLCPELITPQGPVLEVHGPHAVVVH